MSESSSDALVAHHFEDLDQQTESAVLGMWVFLCQEIMFFGGLFAAYMVYRYKYPDAFAAGSQELNIWYGGINTGVLLLSSLTMALSVYSAQTGNRKRLLGFLTITLALGLTFLVIKGLEYAEKFQHHLVPGVHFQFYNEHFPGVNVGNAQMFFVLYFFLTGLHALHMIVGAGLLIWLIVLAYRGHFSPQRYMKVELSGFYWHFVDIVWVFLFPLLYLVDRHV